MSETGREITEAEMQRIAQAFVGAANARDPEALCEIFEPDGELRPSVLVGSRSTYTGHDGLRQYFRSLRDTDAGQMVQIAEVRRIREDQFVALVRVTLGAEVLSPAALIITVRNGRIARAEAHLSDEPTLIAVGLIPRPR